MGRSTRQSELGPASALTIGVLGPLEVLVAARPVTLPSGRLRMLLAVLAACAGAPASAERLADAIWGEDLPDDARRAVQTYVARLRNALGADAIYTSAEGTALPVPSPPSGTIASTGTTLRANGTTLRTAGTRRSRPRSRRPIRCRYCRPPSMCRRCCQRRATPATR